MNTEFFNEQVNVNDLPKVESITFVPLEKDYLKVLIWSRVISLSTIGILLLITILVVPESIPRILIKGVPGLYAAYVVWVFISTVKGFKHKAYAIRERDILYKSGWLWRSITTAPFSRVQHLRIDQGPIERQFKLSKLKIFTAGGSSSDISIPGLNPQMAKELKEFIVKRSHDEEE